MFAPQVERRTAGQHIDFIPVVGKSIDHENCCSIVFFAITLTVFDDHFHFHFLHQVISMVHNLLDNSSRPISARKIALLIK